MFFSVAAFTLALLLVASLGVGNSIPARPITVHDAPFEDDPDGFSAALGQFTDSFRHQCYVHEYPYYLDNKQQSTAVAAVSVKAPADDDTEYNHLTNPHLTPLQEYALSAGKRLFRAWILPFIDAACGWIFVVLFFALLLSTPSRGKLQPFIKEAPLMRRACTILENLQMALWLSTIAFVAFLQLPFKFSWKVAALWGDPVCLCLMSYRWVDALSEAVLTGGLPVARRNILFVYYGESNNALVRLTGKVAGVVRFLLAVSTTDAVLRNILSGDHSDGNLANLIAEERVLCCLCGSDAFVEWIVALLRWNPGGKVKRILKVADLSVVGLCFIRLLIGSTADHGMSFFIDFGTLTLIAKVALMHLDLYYFHPGESAKESKSTPIEEDKDDGDDDICKICELNEIDCVAIPCGHMYCCSQCCRTALLRRKCPICSAGCSNYYRFYRS